MAVHGTPQGYIYPGFVGDVEDDRAERLIAAGHATSAETLAGRDPGLVDDDVPGTWTTGADDLTGTLDANQHSTMDDPPSFTDPPGETL